MSQRRPKKSAKKSDLPSEGLVSDRYSALPSEGLETDEAMAGQDTCDFALARDFTSLEMGGSERIDSGSFPRPDFRPTPSENTDSMIDEDTAAAILADQTQDSGLGTCTSELLNSNLGSTQSSFRPEPAQLQEVRPKERKQTTAKPAEDAQPVAVSGTQPAPQALALQLFQQDQEGDNDLMLSIIHVVPRVTQHIITHAGHPELLNATNALQQTALHLAVLTRQGDIARDLVRFGANMMVRDRAGNTPLHIACALGNLQCVIALIQPLSLQDMSSSPYELPYRQIPQDMAVYNYNGDSVLHLAYEGRLNARQASNTTHVTAYTSILHALLSPPCRANVNLGHGRTGHTLLHLAVLHKDVDFIQWLLTRSDVNIESLTFNKRTALQLAYFSRFNHIQQILVDKHADEEMIEGYGIDSEEEL